MTGSESGAPVRIDTGRPHPARVYDWWLGGKDNYPVDEELARRILAVDGTVLRGARANRRFMQRAVRIVAEAGTRQFLDIGTGIPTEPNLHQVAQSVAPEARVVYADNDPARRRAPRGTSTPTSATWTRCWAGRPSRWTSTGRSPCRWWRSPTTWTRTRPATTCTGCCGGTSPRSRRAAT
jgi:predicted P-loop ATPase